MASAAWEEEDWELCNDDGFVYKRKKRRQDTTPPPLLATDPEAEQRLLKERKKRSLLKLKNQYQREIDQWERMTHTLQAMENRTQPQPQTQPSSPPPPSSSMFSSRHSDSAFRQLIDDLLLQAEGQEAILQDLSNLCDHAENLCNAEEERLKQPFIDLPVWETPGALMDFFCDESQD
ncbi:uncharacterized protein LOC122076990 [Macadamia integrifolia]|uniref:uncharacterized protein LOC122076990 n=1 Tax=Macadamia integrifolia TaxID=60698 RepID=UPI001C4E3223|nr:uncharacterized protein LOC122076990 [Macadamia integrifolia]